MCQRFYLSIRRLSQVPLLHVTLPKLNLLSLRNKAVNLALK